MADMDMDMDAPEEEMDDGMMGCTVTVIETVRVTGAAQAGMKVRWACWPAAQPSIGVGCPHRRTACGSKWSTRKA